MLIPLLMMWTLLLMTDWLMIFAQQEGSDIEILRIIIMRGSYGQGKVREF